MALTAKIPKANNKKSIKRVKRLDFKTCTQKIISFIRKLFFRLSLDEVALSEGELYTMYFTSKADKEVEKGVLLPSSKEQKSDEVIDKILKINRNLRLKVKEITLDMAGSMKLIHRNSVFPNATQVVDRFHVQKLS